MKTPKRKLKYTEKPICGEPEGTNHAADERARLKRKNREMQYKRTIRQGSETLTRVSVYVEEQLENINKNGKSDLGTRGTLQHIAAILRDAGYAEKRAIVQTIDRFKDIRNKLACMQDEINSRIRELEKLI